jgi:hypothetical protein
MKELIRPNGFGPFHCEGREILRQIFVTLRDRQWQEISPTQWNCRIDDEAGRISVEARHLSESVDFEWRGVLEVAADGHRVRFAFEGAPRRSMEVCRLGLVVLHPVDGMVGARVTAHGEHRIQTLVLSREIAPQPVIDGMPQAMMEPFSRLTIEQQGEDTLELTFEGDAFELEDQRNWGDASFKTYCTPLRLGFPRRIEAGARIAHGVELSVKPAAGSARRTTSMQMERRKGVFPEIGCKWPGSADARHQDIDWRYQHVDLAGSVRSWHNPSFDTGARVLEIGADAHAFETQFSELVEWFARSRVTVARVLLYGSGLEAPSPQRISFWRNALDGIGARDVPLLAATRGHFVEHNRSAAGQRAPMVGVAFPLTATVHADDALTIAENVAAIVDMTDTARGRFRSALLAIVPLDLYYPARIGTADSTSVAGFPRVMIAPWLAATLLAAAEAGAASVTLGQELVAGVSETLLRRLLSCAGREVTRLSGDGLAHLHAASLRSSADGQEHVLVANLSGTAVQWRQGAGVTLVAAQIPAFGVRWLEAELNPHSEEAPYRTLP